MPGIDALLTETASVTIPTAGDPLTVVYRPSALTPRQVAFGRHYKGVDISTLPDDEQQAVSDALPRMLSALLVSWTLTDNDGKPVPATLAGLQDVPYAAQSIVFSAIMADQQTPKATGSAPSPASSTPASPKPLEGPPAISSLPAPTGTPTSSLPTSSASPSSSSEMSLSSGWSELGSR